MKLTPAQRAQLKDLRDRYRESPAFFREVAQSLREALHQRGYTDEQIDAAIAKKSRKRARSA